MTFFWLLLLLVAGNNDVVGAKYDDQDANKALKICSVAGGLDIARLVSSRTRTFFRCGIEDVELIREFISESAYNGGIAGGLHDLYKLSKTLDTKARNLTSTSATTVFEGLGFADDRKDRRMERYVGLANEPYVGSKESDLALIDSASNIFPWIVDRQSAPDKWSVSHPNGASATLSSKFDRLYVAAWIGTRGEAWMYYPPLAATYGHPLNFGDLVGGAYDSREEVFVKPNLPENNPERKAYFTAPYADTTVPGLALITAQAPVYFTGEFQGYTYNNTYVASTGVDISVASMSTVLADLEGTLTKGSFALLVGAEDFHIIVISQKTVEKLYPARTGFEESRVTYSKTDGSILSDRRNQTYLVSDTISQKPTELDNARWTYLASEVKALLPGQRSSTLLDITLTGEQEPTTFHAMYERWPDVADWTLVLFAPQNEVDNAVSVHLDQQQLDLEIMEDSAVLCKSIIANNGTIDVIVRIEKLPPWFILLGAKEVEYSLAVGESLTLEYMVSSKDIPGKATSLIAFTVTDADYPDCYYEQVLTTTVEMIVTYEEELNQLDGIRPYGFALSALIVFTALGCSIWVILNEGHRVVRASQPLFLHMMCTGILVMGLSIIPMGIDDSVTNNRGCDIACMSVPWLLVMGFSIAYSALFSKIMRLNQIVRACKNYRRVEVSAHHFMVPFFSIISANVTLLGVWTGIDPLVWTREPADGSRGSHESFGRCSLNGSELSMTFLILLLVVNFVALLLALIQLYRARELSTEYSEGKYIAIAVGSMLQVFLTGLPILIIVTDSPQLSFFVQSTIVFVVAMSLLLLTFVPKFCMQAKGGAGQSIMTQVRESSSPRRSGGSKRKANVPQMLGEPGTRGEEELEIPPVSNVDVSLPSEDSDSVDSSSNSRDLAVIYVDPGASRNATISEVSASLATISEAASEVSSDSESMYSSNSGHPDNSDGPCIYVDRGAFQNAMISEVSASLATISEVEDEVSSGTDASAPSEKSESLYSKREELRDSDGPYIHVDTTRAARTSAISEISDSVGTMASEVDEEEVFTAWSDLMSTDSRSIGHSKFPSGASVPEGSTDETASTTWNTDSPLGAPGGSMGTSSTNASLPIRCSSFRDTQLGKMPRVSCFAPLVKAAPSSHCNATLPKRVSSVKPDPTSLYENAALPPRVPSPLGNKTIIHESSQ